MRGLANKQDLCQLPNKPCLYHCTGSCTRSMNQINGQVLTYYVSKDTICAEPVVSVNTITRGHIAPPLLGTRGMGMPMDVDHGSCPCIW